jgi:hypothetical protein
MIGGEQREPEMGGALFELRVGRELGERLRGLAGVVNKNPDREEEPDRIREHQIRGKNVAGTNGKDRIPAMPQDLEEN